MRYEPEIKICGITNFEDARKSIELGARFLGFIHYRKSPRFIEVEEILSLLEKLKGMSCKTVLVDVDPDAAKLKDLSSLGFDYHQLHFSYGTSAKRLKSWVEIIGKTKLWLAPQIPPETQFPDSLLDFSEHFLLDAYSSSEFGGTGKKSDWTEFQRCKKNHPQKNWILAGGLDTKNALRAISELEPRIMDFNSGVEMEPGRKDHAKLTELFQSLKVLFES